MNDTFKIQAPVYTEDRKNTHTELGRIVAAHSEWVVDEDDEVFDAAGVKVAGSIVEMAEAMRELGWFVPHLALRDPTQTTYVGVGWSQLPGGPDENRERADAVRRQLRS